MVRERSSVSRRTAIKVLGAGSAVGLSGLAGCSGDGGDGGDGGGDGGDGGDGGGGTTTSGNGEWPDLSGQELHFVTDSNAQAAQKFYKRMVNGFAEATGADTQLEFVTAGTSGMQRIIQLIQAGDPPEVSFMAAGNIYELVNNDLVEPVNDVYADVSKRLGEPADAIKQVITMGDTTYFIPMISNISVYTYRGDVSDVVPNTWDKAIDYAEGVSNGDSGLNGTYVPSMTGSPSTVRFLAWLWTNEGSISTKENGKWRININEEPYRGRAIELLNFLKTRQQWSPPASGAGWSDLINVIQTETAASSWYAGARAKNACIFNDRPFADDVHVTAGMPKKRQNAAEGSAEGLLTFKDSNTKVGKTFMRYMFTKENLIDFLVNLSPVHNIPAWTSIATSDEYRQRLNQTEVGKGWSEADLNTYQVESIERLFHKTMEGGTNETPNPYPSIYYSQPIWGLQSDVLLKNKDPGQALDQRAKELQQVLNDVQGSG